MKRFKSSGPSTWFPLEIGTLLDSMCGCEPMSWFLTKRSKCFLLLSKGKDINKWGAIPRMLIRFILIKLMFKILQNLTSTTVEMQKEIIT
jgi:hypothetical protein